MRGSDWKLALGFGLGLVMAMATHAQPIEAVATRLDTPTTGDGAPADNFGIAIATSGNRAVIGAYGDVIVAPGVANGVAEGSAYVFTQAVDGTWAQTQKLTPEPLGGDGDNFGLAVAFSGDLIAIGAPRRAAAGLKAAGTVYLYSSSGGAFSLIQTIVSNAPVADARFGAALALTGDYLAIGSPQAGRGRVELYRLAPSGIFTFERSFVAPVTEAEAARFGHALALSASELLIGAPQASGGGAVFASSRELGIWGEAGRLLLDPAATTSELGFSLSLDSEVALVGLPGAGPGQVRVLSRSAKAWAEVAILAAPGLQNGARFGQALDLGPARAVVGATGALGGDGAGFIFVRNGAQFLAPQAVDVADGGFADRFGIAVADTQNGVLIGADLDDIYSNSGQGAVYSFVPGFNGNLQLNDRLDTGDGAYLDRFGTAVAIEGNIAMVGAYLEDTEAGADAGAVHWFERTGNRWSRRGRITAPDGRIEDRFGIAVDIEGDRVAIGAFWDVIGTNVDQGSVYIFHRSGDDWVFETKLVAADGRERDLFGFALALDGDRLLVGARGARVPNLDQGTAYVFRRLASGSWVQEARLNAPSPASGLFFGASVDLSAGRALIGAPGAQVEPGVANAGAAYVFQGGAGGWLYSGRLIAPQPRESAAFGFSVASDSQRLLAGAFLDAPDFNAIGAAYVFNASDRVLEATLRAALPQPGEIMGISVAIDGGLIALGSSGYDINGISNAGSVRLFERGLLGWRETRQLVAIDPGFGDGFGRAVAAADGSILIGAPGKARANPLEGAAYVYDGDWLMRDGFE